MTNKFKQMTKPTLLVTAVIMAGCVAGTGTTTTGTRKHSSTFLGSLGRQQSASETNATLTPLPVRVLPSMAVNPGPDIPFTANNPKKVAKTSTRVSTVRRPVKTEKTKITSVSYNDSNKVGRASIYGASKEMVAITKPSKKLAGDSMGVVRSKDSFKEFETSEVTNKVTQKTAPKVKKASDVLSKYEKEAKSSAKKEVQKATQKVAKVTKPVKEKVKEVVNRPASTIKKGSDVISNETVRAKKAAAALKPKAVSKAEKAANTAKNKAKSASDKVKKVANQGSAIKALLKEARNAVGAGNLDKAANALERAHRIQPKNAKILYDIAQIRYAQGKYAQAESFASKATRASSSRGLSKKAWTILSKARQGMGNSIGAKTAKKKAASF